MQLQSDCLVTICSIIYVSSFPSSHLCHLKELPAKIIPSVA